VSRRDRLRARAAETGRDVRVALVGAGQMGRGFAAQLGRMPGVTVSAVVDVDRSRAEEALAGIGADVAQADNAAARASLVASGRSVALTDLAEAVDLDVDVVVEATGVPDVGARVCVQAMLAGKHVSTLNVECDVTIGLLLRGLATATGTVYSVCRGDEPTEAKKLVDFSRDLGFEVVAAGKGKNNPFSPTADPDTCAAEAKAKGMNPKMLCSFVDGSKAMIEMAALANTTGLRMSTRGMHGPHSTVEGLSTTFALREDGGVLERAGVVDYCTGPVAPGVFVVVRCPDEYVAHEMSYLKMGPGPYFHLYRPYHLASVEAPLTVYDTVLDGRASLVAEWWTAEVAAATKKDLPAGTVVDGIGAYCVRGVADDSQDFAADGLVPIGVTAGARLRRDVAAGALLTVDDVELDQRSLIVRLRALQDELGLAKGLHEGWSSDAAPGVPPLDVDPGAVAERLQG
jgi:predicted homoserine dehydrogenase-like protein